MASVPPLLVHDAFEKWATADPARPALLSYGDTALTYGQLGSLSCNVCASLHNIALPINGPVGVLINGRDTRILCWSTWSA